VRSIVARANAAVILQARLGSSRLPGKALAWIGGRSILLRCLDRLQQRSPLPVVLATTDRPEDDALEQVAEEAGYMVCRGPADDVLTRFVMVARGLGLDYVIRATGDNPAVDMDAPSRVLSALMASGADHVDELYLPYGAAVEGVTSAALERAASLATEPGDREHVTTLIRRDKVCFNSIMITAPIALRRSDIRLTIDTPDDLLFMRRLMNEFDPAVEPSLSTIIAAYQRVACQAVA
jgi:spore coat polysaccharide biosynthesis protein SpsF